MKINVGDYVRTKDGIIAKCIKEECDRYVFDKIIVEDGYYKDYEYKDVTPRGSYILKSSPNIIDILEVGDYVNGYLVKDIDYAFDDVVMNNKNARVVPYIDCNKNNYIDDIKSIVTKEQFESMEYKVGDKENE